MRKVWLLVGAVPLACAAGCGSSGTASPATVTATTTATASTTVTTTVTATPSTTPVATQLAQFAGTWSGHGRTLTLTAGGAGSVVYRIYTFCSDDPTPPCDQMNGNEIVPGGKLTFQLTDARAAAAPEGIGTVLSSTDTALTAGTPVIISLKSGVITASFLDGATFCDAAAQAQSTCGA